MPNLNFQLQLPRCPHCNVHTPSLHQQWRGQTQDNAGQNLRAWSAYLCSSCGGLVTAWATGFDQPIQAYFPANREIPTDLPVRAAKYLEQAVSTLHAPAGAVMLAASAVDSMLKAKAYGEGTLYSRIDKAAADHVITAEMAKWAHAVPLDANVQPHGDEAADLPSEADAKRCIDFAMALAQFLYTLPAMVRKGLAE